MPFGCLHVFDFIQSCDHIGKDLAEAYIPPIFMFTCSRALVRLINTDFLFHSFNHHSEKVGAAIFVHVRNPIAILALCFSFWPGIGAFLSVRASLHQLCELSKLTSSYLTVSIAAWMDLRSSRDLRNPTALRTVLFVCKPIWK